MRSTCARWPDALKDHITEVKELGIVDPSITEIDIDAVTSLTEGYGIAAIEQTTQALVAWNDRYRWRTALEALDRLREATDQELDPELADEQLA